MTDVIITGNALITTATLLAALSATCTTDDSARWKRLLAVAP